MLQTDPTDESLRALVPALLLAATGGLLDSVVYLLHGHVFANAMTGNVVLMGITALSRQPGQALRHLVPLCAFFAGVAASKALRSYPARSAVQSSLALEAFVVTIAGALPVAFPQMVFTAIIAFVSAFQVASFRRVQRFTYNSTFITGNLRDTAEGFYDWLASPDPDARREGLLKSRALGLICVCFFAGALTGAATAPRIGNRALWIAVPLLLAVLAHTLRRTPAAS
jgi:uncharacterized membrane protein YoaK (UPF0700 family)